MVPRLARWSDERPITADACLAVLLLVVFVLPSDLSSEDGGWGDVAISTLLLACVPFRRRAPVATFAVVSVICLAQIALLDHIVAGDVVALIALYTVVAYGPGTRVGVAATACAALGAALGTVRWERADGVTLVETGVTTPHRRLGHRGAPAGRGGRGRHRGAHRGRVRDGGDVSAGRRLAAS